MLSEVLKRDATEDVTFLRAQAAWLQGDFTSAQEHLQQALEQANAGGRAAMRREMGRLFGEHPQRAGQETRRALLMKLAV